jgi:hypothetical protein
MERRIGPVHAMSYMPTYGPTAQIRSAEATFYGKRITIPKVLRDRAELSFIGGECSMVSVRGTAQLTGVQLCS